MLHIWLSVYRVMHCGHEAVEKTLEFGWKCKICCNQLPVAVMCNQYTRAEGKNNKCEISCQYRKKITCFLWCKEIRSRRLFFAFLPRINKFNLRPHKLGLMWCFVVVKPHHFIHNHKIKRIQNFSTVMTVQALSTMLVWRIIEEFFLLFLRSAFFYCYGHRALFALFGSSL